MTAMVKGIACLLDVGEVARVLGRPERWVREQLLKTGLLRSVRLGGNSFRVRPCDLSEWIECNVGTRHVAGSSRWRGKTGRTG